LVSKAREVIEEAQHNSTRQQAMAAAARDAAVANFNALAMLDSVVWSLLRIKEMCTWEVRGAGMQVQRVAMCTCCRQLRHRGRGFTALAGAGERAIPHTSALRDCDGSKH
jgi:hypothetical protein